MRYGTTKKLNSLRNLLVYVMCYQNKWLCCVKLLRK